MDEVNQSGGNVEVMQLLDHQVPLDGIKSRTEVHEEYPGEVAWGIQVLQEEVQQTYSILCAPLNLVGKLEGVQLWVDSWQDGVQQQLLQAFHDYGC